MTRYRSLAVTLFALTGILLSGCKSGGVSSASSGTSATPVANHASRPLAAAPSTGFLPWGSYRTTAYARTSPSTTSTTSGTSSTGGTGSTSQSTQSSTQTTTSGSVTLNWTPPTQNTDGSTLTNLAGYYIDYGTQSGDYTQTIQLANPGLSSYVVQNLAAGTYYFVVTAYNSDGTQSIDSNEVSTSVN